MNKYNFPRNYQTRINNKETLKYINLYYNLLKNELVKTFNLIECFDPVVTFSLDTKNSFSSFYRPINFDNRNNNDLVSIYDDLGFWLREKIIDYKIDNDEGIYILQNHIKRDADMSGLDSLISQRISIEYKTSEENLSISNLKNLFTMINDIIQKISHKNLIRNLENNEIINKLEFITSQELEDKYKFFKLHQGLEKLVKQKKAIVILQPYKKLISGNFFDSGLPLSENYECSGELYYYDKINKKPILILKITIRPSGKIVYDQIISSIPYAFEEGLYNREKVMKLESLSFGINIEFSNLMLICCQKSHLSEVTSSIWNEEIIKYLKSRKIDIL